MKREEMLLRAIGGVQDQMIHEAMEKKKRPSALRWAAVAACICLMLTVTAGAAKWGVDWWQGRQMGYILHTGQDIEWTFEEELGHTVEWKYPLSPVRIRQEAVDEMTKELNHWWSYRYNHDGGIDPDFADQHFTIGIGYDAGERFSTIAELEEYLGIDLNISPEIDAAARNCMESNDVNTWLEIAIYGDLNRDAEQEYLQTGKITLQGIHITVRMGFSETNCKSWMDIVVPVTQKFADTYPNEVIFNVDENKPFQVETKEFSGREVLVIRDSNEDLQLMGTVKAYGVYGADGIGYCVHSLAEDWGNTEKHPTVYQRGLERLMELLENLE